jgi:uncharacterized protein DUF4230
MRSIAKVVLVALAAGTGLGLVLGLAARRRPPLPDPPAIALRIREVARLETLDVTLYKKVSFAPEPAAADSVWGDVAGWLRHTFRAPRGKAIVFADAHLGLDLSTLDASRVRIAGRAVEVALPDVRATVELRPGETEVIGSNLDSAETAQLLELAKTAFERELAADRALRARARASAGRSIRALLAGLGFTEVVFVGEPISAAWSAPPGQAVARAGSTAGSGPAPSFATRPSSAAGFALSHSTARSRPCPIRSPSSA